MKRSSHLLVQELILICGVLIGLASALLVTTSVSAAPNFNPVVTDYFNYSFYNGDRSSLSCVVSQVRVLERRYDGGAITANKRLCISEGKTYRLGRGSIYDGATYVSFSSSGLFYRVNTTTSQGVHTLYAHAGTDLVALNVGQRGGATSSVPALYATIYDILEPGSGFSEPYRLYMSGITTKQLFQASDGSQYGWGVSNNGKFVAYIDMYDPRMISLNRGVYLASIDSGKVRKIADLSSMPYDSSTLLSIADDGRIIVVATSQGMRIYTVSDECGADDSRIGGTCTYTDHTIELNVDGRYRYLDQQKPNHDFSEITYLLGVDQTYSRVTVNLRGAVDKKRIDYLALGDSYSSGEGDIVSGSSHFYIAGTEGRGQCHLSRRSYPYALQKLWSVEASFMRSVACSGAKMLRDYMAITENYNGQTGQFKDEPNEVRLSEGAKAVTNFLPGIIPQLEFVRKYKPKVITLNGGGNDVGFADILRYCATPTWQGLFVSDTCSYASDESARNRLLHTIHNQYGITSILIGKIRAESPMTKIYIIGYPQFIAQPLVTCAYNAAALDGREREMIRSMVSEMNDVLYRAAVDGGVTFVDIEDSLEGGQLCQGSRYVTGLHDLSTSMVMNSDIQNAFHPNAAGHLRIAQSIYSQAPQPFSAPDVSSRDSAKDGAFYNEAPTTQRQLLSSEVIALSSRFMVANRESVFKPGSSVSLSIHSNPVSLGSVRTNEHGAFSADVVLPEEVGMGFHTLIAEGVSYAGEPIILYQYITVTSDTANDADGDGIPDVQDRCLFIEEWYDEVGGLNICVTREGLDGPQIAQGGVVGPAERIAEKDAPTQDTTLVEDIHKPHFMGEEESIIAQLGGEDADEHRPGAEQRESSRILLYLAMGVALCIITTLYSRRYYVQRNSKS